MVYSLTAANISFFSFRWLSHIFQAAKTKMELQNEKKMGTEV